MELYQIRSFIAVAEALNLTRAAKATHQSPSAVSSQIKALESSLGVVLFRRSSRGMSLTPEGHTLLDSARTLDCAARNLARQADRLGPSHAGNLNIGINTDPGFLNLSGLSRWMADTLPQLTLTYVESQTYSTLSMLKQEKIDLGFHFGEIKAPELSTFPIGSTRIRVVLPAVFGPEFKTAALADLFDLPWVWTRNACPFHLAFQSRLDEQGLTLTATADAVDENIVEALVKSGTGAALMREDQAQGLVDQDLAVYWEGPEGGDEPGMDLSLALSCLDNRKDEQLISAFLQEIKAFQMSRHTYSRAGQSGPLVGDF